MSSDSELGCLFQAQMGSICYNVPTHRWVARLSWPK